MRKFRAKVWVGPSNVGAMVSVLRDAGLLAVEAGTEHVYFEVRAESAFPDVVGAAVVRLVKAAHPGGDWSWVADVRDVREVK